MNLMLGFLLAMSVTMALIPPLMQLAGRLQVLDAPSERKVHATPIPRVGGIAMAAGVLLGLLLLREFSQPMPAFLCGLIVLLIFGVLDDRFELSAGSKFVGQIIAALIVMTWGGVTIDSITLTERHALAELVAYPLTFFFLLGVTNAINLSDGLDGLAGGTTFLSLCALALLALACGNPFVTSVAIVSIGAIFGFLRFNTHPARIFMGDGGSQLLGYSAAVLAIEITQNPQSVFSTALPLLLLGIPIIDTLMVMTQRVLAGRSPFSADRNHIHHRLLSFGFDHHEAVVAIYVLQGLLFIAAWFLRFESDLTILALFLVSAASVVSAIHLAQQRGWRWRRPTPQPQESPVSRLFEWAARPAHLPRWSLIIIGACIGFYWMVIGSTVRPVDADVRYMTVSLGALLVVALLVRWNRPEAGWIEKVCLYTGGVIAVYLDHRTHFVWTGILERGEWLIFGTLLVAILLRFRLSSDRRFRVTPLDVLVVFAAVTVPNLPGTIVVPGLGLGVAKLVLLFYGLESLLGASGRVWRIPCIAFLIFAAMCAVA